MNLDVSLFSSLELFIAMALWGMIVGYCALSIRWHIVREHGFITHIFFAATIALTVLSLLRTGVMPNLGIHLMGLTAATLMMGWRFAILASAFSLSLSVLIGLEAPISMGVNGLIYGVVPVLVSYAFCRLLQVLLPHNPFVFIIGAAFFGGCFSLAAVIVVNASMHLLLDIYSWQILWDKYTKFILVIVYPEGFINGVFITSMIAFYPRVLSCFDPHSYFK